MKSVFLLDEAYEDLEKGRSFYEEQRSGLGEDFIASVLADVQSLAALHGFHSTRFGFNWLMATKFPFGIYYRVFDEGIQVFAIIDQRSRPRNIRGALRKRQ